MANQRRREIFTLVVVFAGVLLLSALAVYYLGGGRRATRESIQQEPRQPDAVLEAPTERGSPPPAQSASPTVRASEGASFVDRLFGTGHGESQLGSGTWLETMLKIALRLTFASLLGAALAFRPRKRILALKRNPYVAQTQILLAIVAAALMMIVGDNAARAFGIFAAVSLVRFRTNIRDPKEITVLLISLALGLAAGVGRWDLALVLALFSLLVLWVLEWREPDLVFRSMELKVTTRNVVSTQNALRQVFKTHGFDKELRALDREAGEDSPGSIMYSVDVSPAVSTDEISADILAIDGPNVQGIEWDQKKSYSYLYQ